MFVDASAICAVLLTEEDGNGLYERMRSAKRAVTSPMAVWESVITIARRFDTRPTDARQAVMRMLRSAGVELIAIQPDAADLAVEAFERFGKGRHPAGLNFGDCFAYACALQIGMPLLYKGEDFARTDIAAA